jgi:hypothetical protein
MNTVTLVAPLGGPLDQDASPGPGTMGWRCSIRRYMDGGVDGASGCGVELALTPEYGPKSDQELQGLRSPGSRVLAIAPDADSEAARGPHPQDVRRVRPAAEAGYRQASALMAEVRTFWTDPGVHASPTASH